MDDPRYPIGPFRFSGQANAESRARCVAEIAAAPDEAKALQVGIAVASVPSRAPTSPRQEPDLLIVPDSRDVTLRSFGKSTDRQE